MVIRIKMNILFHNCNQQCVQKLGDVLTINSVKPEAGSVVYALYLTQDQEGNMLRSTCTHVVHNKKYKDHKKVIH